MTKIRCWWAPAGGLKMLSWETESAPTDAFGFLHATHGPDVFVEAHAGGVCLVLANGLCEDADPSKQRGTLDGAVSLEVDGAMVFEDVPVVVRDGRGATFRVGSPAPFLPLPPDYQDEVLRGYGEIEDVGDLVSFVKVASIGDPAKLSPANPDGAKEDRIVQAHWLGAIAYALNLRKDEVMAHCRSHVDRELYLRPCLYYDKNGAPIGTVRNDVWIDERGMRKGYHGKWLRDAGPFGQMEDPEHLAPKRVHLGAAAGEPVCRLYARFHAQAICTRPGVKSVKPQQQARAIGYQLEYLTHAVEVGALLDLQGFASAYNVVAGTLLTSGKGVSGIPFFGCWPVGTVHTTHVSCNEADDKGQNPKLSLPDAKGFLAWRGLDAPAGLETMTAAAFIKHLQNLEADSEGFDFEKGDLTTGPEGFQTFLNGVACWGIAIAARGMAAARRLWGDLNLGGLEVDAGRFLVHRACTIGLDRHGKQIAAQTVFDSVAPRSWRVRQANIPNGGTSRWCVPGFLALADLIEDVAGFGEAKLAQRLRAAARRVVEHSPDLEVGSEGVAWVEVAGLPAVARFG